MRSMSLGIPARKPCGCGTGNGWRGSAPACLPDGGAAAALRRGAEARGGGPLPRVRTAQPHHADARLSEKQGTAHGVDRRAGARPAQAETRAGARGVEAEGGGGGRVRKVEIA